MYMDNTISNQNRNTTGIGKGGSVSDIKPMLSTGSEIDRNKQKQNKNFQSPPGWGTAHRCIESAHKSW